MSITILVVAGLAALFVVGVLAFVFIRANQVNLTETGDEKPEWMRQTPPPETLAATRADDEGFQVFDHDPGEQMASPFAEQIEDILRARLQAHPELSHYEVDFGTNADSGLEIWVNGQKFGSIDDLPTDLRQVLQQAVDSWNKHSS